MDFVFDIAGHRCTADRVKMRGNTLEAVFSVDAFAALAEAFGTSEPISVANFPVTYSVQHYRAEGKNGCKAIFLVNSAAGRVLH